MKKYHKRLVIYSSLAFLMVLVFLTPWWHELQQVGGIQVFEQKDFYFANKSGILHDGGGCVLTDMDPKFPLCVHNPESYLVILRAIIRDGTYEEHVGIIMKR